MYCCWAKRHGSEPNTCARQQYPKYLGLHLDLESKALSTGLWLEQDAPQHQRTALLYRIDPVRARPNNKRIGDRNASVDPSGAGPCLRCRSPREEDRARLGLSKR